MTRLGRFGLALLAAYLVASCAKGGAPEPSPAADGSAAIDSVHDASLTETYWKLVEVNHQPVATDSGMREVHFVLGADGKLKGFAGCNRMGGTYALSGDSLRFMPFVTRMACPDLPKEAMFLAALDSTKTCTVSGERLDLMGAEGSLVARFESVYLK